jgi:hypothetical protein
MMGLEPIIVTARDPTRGYSLTFQGRLPKESNLNELHLRQLFTSSYNAGFLLSIRAIQHD